MGKKVEHLHWPDAPKLWMPYAPVIKVTGGNLVFLAGVTAAPVYHSHPHRPEEFDVMPLDMEGQARAALENLKKSLEAVDADFGDVVSANRFLTDMEGQDSLKGVGGVFRRQQTNHYHCSGGSTGYRSALSHRGECLGRC